jgi:hypothetical protein
MQHHIREAYSLTVPRVETAIYCHESGRDMIVSFTSLVLRCSHLEDPFIQGCAEEWVERESKKLNGDACFRVGAFSTFAFNGSF